VWPEIIRSEELRAGLRTELTFWRQTVSQLLSEAKEQGQLKPEVDPEALTVLLICAWEGLRHYALVDPDSFRPERLIDLMHALVTEGVSVEAERPGRELTREPLPPPFRTRPIGSGGREEK